MFQKRAQKSETKFGLVVPISERSFLLSGTVDKKTLKFLFHIRSGVSKTSSLPKRQSPLRWLVAALHAVLLNKNNSVKLSCPALT